MTNTVTSQMLETFTRLLPANQLQILAYAKVAMVAEQSTKNSLENKIKKENQNAKECIN